MKKIRCILIVVFIFSMIPNIILDIIFNEILPPYSIVNLEYNNYSLFRSLKYKADTDEKMPYFACKVKLNKITYACYLNEHRDFFKENNAWIFNEEVDFMDIGENQILGSYSYQAKHKVKIQISDNSENYFETNYMWVTVFLVEEKTGEYLYYIKYI